MTLTLELAPGQEAEVRARAAQKDPAADAYLAALVRYALDVYTREECGPAPAPGESAYDAMKDLIGTINSAELAALSRNPRHASADPDEDKGSRGRL